MEGTQAYGVSYQQFVCKLSADHMGLCSLAAFPGKHGTAATVTSMRLPFRGKGKGGRQQERSGDGRGRGKVTRRSWEGRTYGKRWKHGGLGIGLLLDGPLRDFRPSGLTSARIVSFSSAS